MARKISKDIDRIANSSPPKTRKIGPLGTKSATSGMETITSTSRPKRQVRGGTF